MKRKTTFRTSYLLFLAILAVMLVFVNVIANRVFARKDLTQGQIYSISLATKRIFLRLGDTLKVTLYITATEDMPLLFRNLRRDTVDKLREFDKYAGRNFEYRVIDIDSDVFQPDKLEKDPKLKALAEQLDREGIQPIPWRITQAERVETVLLHSAITIAYLDKPKSLILPYEDPLTLEYEIAKEIVSLTADKKPTIAFYDGKPKSLEPGRPMRSPMGPRLHEYTSILTNLRDLFDVVEIRLDEKSPVPDDTGCLVIAQPKDLTPRQKYEINNFISQGRPAIFLVSPVSVDFASRAAMLPAEQNFHGLDEMFKAWGLSLGRELVADARFGIAMPSYQRIRGMTVISEMFMPVVFVTRGEFLNSESALTRNIGQLLIPAATPITLDEDALNKNGVRHTVLARSSEEAWFVHVWQSSLPAFLLTVPGNKELFRGSQNVAVLLEGKFPFLYAGKLVPEWGPSGEITAPPSTGVTTSEAPATEDEDAVTTEPPDAEGTREGVEATQPPDEREGSANAGDASSDGSETNEEPEENVSSDPIDDAHQPLDDASRAPATGVGDTSAGRESGEEATAEGPSRLAGGEEGEAATIEPTAAEEAGVEPAEQGVPSGETEAVSPAALAPAIPEPFELQPSTVLVVSTADLLKPSALPALPGQFWQGNVVFFRNALEAMALGEDLITIRSKVLTGRSLENVTAGKKAFFRALNIAAIPLLVIIFGLGRLYLRYRDKVLYQERFIPAEPTEAKPPEKERQGSDKG